MPEIKKPHGKLGMKGLAATSMAIAQFKNPRRSVEGQAAHLLAAEQRQLKELEDSVMGSNEGEGSKSDGIERNTNQMIEVLRSKIAAMENAAKNRIRLCEEDLKKNSMESSDKAPKMLEAFDDIFLRGLKDTKTGGHKDNLISADGVFIDATHLVLRTKASTETAKKLEARIQESLTSSNIRDGKKIKTKSNAMMRSENARKTEQQRSETKKALRNRSEKDLQTNMERFLTRSVMEPELIFRAPTLPPIARRHSIRRTTSSKSEKSHHSEQGEDDEHRKGFTEDFKKLFKDPIDQVDWPIPLKWPSKDPRSAHPDNADGEMDPPLLLRYSIDKMNIPSGDGRFHALVKQTTIQQYFVYIFWLIKVKFFEPTSDPENERFLLHRMSEEYRHIVDIISAQAKGAEYEKDRIYQYLPYIMATAVYFGFKFLCPGSRHIYTKSFRKTILMQVIKVMHGIQLCSASIRVLWARLFPEETHDGEEDGDEAGPTESFPVKIALTNPEKYAPVNSTYAGSRPVSRETSDIRRIAQSAVDALMSPDSYPDAVAHPSALGRDREHSHEDGGSVHSRLPAKPHGGLITGDHQDHSRDHERGSLQANVSFDMGEYLLHSGDSVMESVSSQEEFDAAGMSVTSVKYLKNFAAVARGHLSHTLGRKGFGESAGALAMTITYEDTHKEWDARTKAVSYAVEHFEKNRPKMLNRLLRESDFVQSKAKADGQAQGKGARAGVGAGGGGADDSDLASEVSKLRGAKKFRSSASVPSLKQVMNEFTKLDYIDRATHGAVEPYAIHDALASVGGSKGKAGAGKHHKKMHGSASVESNLSVDSGMLYSRGTSVASHGNLQKHAGQLATDHDEHRVIHVGADAPLRSASAASAAIGAPGVASSAINKAVSPPQNRLGSRAVISSAPNELPPLGRGHAGAGSSSPNTDRDLANMSNFTDTRGVLSSAEKTARSRSSTVLRKSSHEILPGTAEDVEPGPLQKTVLVSAGPPSNMMALKRQPVERMNAKSKSPLVQEYFLSTVLAPPGSKTIGTQMVTRTVPVSWCRTGGADTHRRRVVQKDVHDNIIEQRKAIEQEFFRATKEGRKKCAETLKSIDTKCKNLLSSDAATIGRYSLDLVRRQRLPRKVGQHAHAHAGKDAQAVSLLGDSQVNLANNPGANDNFDPEELEKFLASI